MMDDKVIEFPKRQEPPDMRGADRNGSDVIIDGRSIPRLHMHDNGETISFVLDGRFLYEFPKEWAYLAGSFAANAMAIGAGYPFMGAESKNMPFAPQCHQIEIATPPEAT